MPYYKSNLDVAGAEILNARLQNLGSAPATTAEGRYYYDTTSHTFKYRSDTGWVSVATSVPSTTYDANTIIKADNDDTPIALTVSADTIVGRVTGVNGGVISALTAAQTRTWLGTLDQFTAPSSAISMGSQRVTNVATPTGATDAANMAYVDSVAQGLDIKTAVRVASTGNVNRTSPGAAIDGVTLTAGDRVLLKNQSTGNQNGIYIFNGASSAMTRSTDADTSAEVKSGMFTFVAEGTANSDRGYVLTTDNPITLDTTSLTFTQFSGAGTVVGTSNRISVTGNQIDIDAAYVGQASITTLGTVATGVWHGTAVAVLYGGTGATDIATARSNLGTVGRYVTTVGNGSATSFTVTHSLGSVDVMVELYDTSSKQTVYADITRIDANSVTVGGFITAPSSGAISVVVLG